MFHVKHRGPWATCLATPSPYGNHSTSAPWSPLPAVGHTFEASTSNPLAWPVVNRRLVADLSINCSPEDAGDLGGHALSEHENLCVRQFQSPDDLGCSIHLRRHSRALHENDLPA